jgi:uncharacterized RDD family membrane protein YckC
MTMSFCSVPLDETSDLTTPGGTPPRRGLPKQPTVSRTGQRLGHFVLQEALGEGGMGAVYRALDTSLQRYVAVKVLRAGGTDTGSSSTAKHTDRLRREAVSQARLNHPRVVTIYYVGRENEEPFLAMELLPGPTLQQRLADGPLPYQELIEYAMQVTDALEAADRGGLVHGDIKPSNLLMASPGNIKLSDFGLSRRSGTSSEDGGVSGTPNYLAPELIDGAPPDLRADMYALGVTLFELTFGRRPYELSGTTLRQQLLSHRTNEVEFPQRWPGEIPEGFRAILQKLLAKNPADRYQSYDQLRGDLQTIRPIGSTLAGRPARLIAWVVDMATLMVLQIPFVIPALIAGFGFREEQRRWFDNTVPVFNSSAAVWLLGSLAMVGWTVVPLLSLWWDLKRYRTPGRYLMQLRVVDKFGLPPSRRVVILRNLMRYASYWSGVLVGIPLLFGFVIAGIVDDAIGNLWILIDGLLIFGPLRRTLHDRICNTHVVLDERASHQSAARLTPGTMIHTS